MYDLKPEFVVIAGPPGSGKSSLVDRFGLDYFNVDDKAAELHGSYKKIPPEVREKAGQYFKEFIDSHFETKRSFTIETTLRTDKELNQVKTAKELGFKNRMIFVCLDHPDKNVERVLGRSQDGGHSAPEAFIKETYKKSLENLSLACKEFDKVVAYDNSGKEPIRVFEIQKGELVYLKDQTPAWAIESLERAGLVQGKDFQKYQISVISKEDFKKYSHNIYVSKESWARTETKDKQSFLHREATKFIDQHPVLSRQDTGKFEISIKPAVKELTKKGPELSK